MNVYIVRHGQVLHNALKVYSNEDEDLTEKGIGQAKQLKNEIQNLEIIEVNANENYILVSGNIPGAKQSLVFIKSAVKKHENAEVKEILEYENETVVDEVVEDTTANTAEEPVVEAQKENQEESK